MKGSGFSFRARAWSFRHAFAGICLLLRREHNVWIQCTIAVCVVAAGFLLHLSTIEWAVVSILIGGVLAAEAFNSAIERLCDHVSPQDSEPIKHVKDLTAGGVLLIAIVATVGGLIIFMPKIFALL